MNICDKARDILNYIKTRQVKEFEELQRHLESLDSPIEQILLAEMRKKWKGGITGGTLVGDLPFGLIGSLGLSGMFTFLVHSQVEIKTRKGNKYRADFLINLYRFRSSLTEQDDMDLIKITEMIIEVDGHEFHEKTPQQASYDRRRDRELMLAGYFVLRFTGSDVYNNPEQCVEEIELQLQKLAVSALKEYIDNNKLEDFILLDPEEYRKKWKS